MRLGRLELRRVAAAEAPAPRAPRELGASGTLNLDGYLQQHEYLTDLKGQQGLRVFERMRRSDGSVREALGHCKAPVMNATWTVEAASDDPVDLEIAEAVRRACFVWPAQPFKEYLRQTLSYLDFGHSVFETVWQVVEDELELDDPTGALEPDPTDPTGQRQRRKKVVRPPRQFLTWKRHAQRLPKTIWQWHMDGGDLVSIVQQTFRGSSYVEVEIPAERLLVYVNEREGDDMTGVSILRAAYKPWVMKEIGEKVAGISIERHGVGVNVAYVPMWAKDDAQVIGRIEEMIRDLRSGEKSYMVFPGPKAQAAAASQDGFFFEIISPSSSVPDIVSLLEYHRGEIAGSVLARFSQLGHGSVGARATGDVQSEVWYDAVHAVAAYVCDVNKLAIRRFVDANYQVKRYPTLCASDIETRSLEEYANAVAKLTAVGALTMDRSARAAVRRAVDFPDEDDPTGEAAQKERSRGQPDEDEIEEEDDV